MLVNLKKNATKFEANSKQIFIKLPGNYIYRWRNTPLSARVVILRHSVYNYLDNKRLTSTFLFAVHHVTNKYVTKKDSTNKYTLEYLNRPSNIYYNGNEATTPSNTNTNNGSPKKTFNIYKTSSNTPYTNSTEKSTTTPKSTSSILNSTLSLIIHNKKYYNTNPYFNNTNNKDTLFIPMDNGNNNNNNNSLDNLRSNKTFIKNEFNNQSQVNQSETINLNLFNLLVINGSYSINNNYDSNKSSSNSNTTSGLNNKSYNDSEIITNNNFNYKTEWIKWFNFNNTRNSSNLNNTIEEIEEEDNVALEYLCFICNSTIHLSNATIIFNKTSISIYNKNDTELFNNDLNSNSTKYKNPEIKRMLTDLLTILNTLKASEKEPEMLCKS